MDFMSFKYWLLEVDKTISGWCPMAGSAVVSVEFFARETRMALQLHGKCWI